MCGVLCSLSASIGEDRAPPDLLGAPSTVHTTAAGSATAGAAPLYLCCWPLRRMTVQE